MRSCHKRIAWTEITAMIIQHFEWFTELLSLQMVKEEDF